MYIFDLMFLFYLDKYPEMELVVPFFNFFKETPYCFPW